MIPVPAIIAIAAVAGGGGVAGIVHGGRKMHEAHEELEKINKQHEANRARLEKANKSAAAAMDRLGELELDICESFGSFSDAFEHIKGKPEFADFELGGVTIPRYNPAELKDASVGAGVLLGALGGAGTGTVGGFAAAGAVKAAVAALGTASTGTPIAALSGQAAIDATLAALGGGALAAGGGGVALGTAVLGVAAAGAGLLVGGAVFAIAGEALAGQADEARKQMKRAAKEMAKVRSYLADLKGAAERYYAILSKVNDVYRSHLSRFKQMVYVDCKVDWNSLDAGEKLMVENLVLLVSLLVQMCKVNLVVKSGDDDGLNSVNESAVEGSIAQADDLLKSKGWVK